MRYLPVSDKEVRGDILALSALQIVLVALKAFGIIDWSWLLVLFPTWIKLALAVLFLIFFIIICVIEVVIKELDG